MDGYSLSVPDSPILTQSGPDQFEGAVEMLPLSGSPAAESVARVGGFVRVELVLVQAQYAGRVVVQVAAQQEESEQVLGQRYVGGINGERAAETSVVGRLAATDPDNLPLLVVRG